MSFNELKAPSIGICIRGYQFYCHLDKADINIVGCSIGRGDKGSAHLGSIIHFCINSFLTKMHQYDPVNAQGANLLSSTITNLFAPNCFKMGQIKISNKFVTIFGHFRTIVLGEEKCVGTPD